MKRNKLFEEFDEWHIANLPYEVEQLNSSFIYLDLPFWEDDQFSAQVFNIDPTDKRFAFDNEI
jgi:hypothetical protein